MCSNRAAVMAVVAIVLVAFFCGTADGAWPKTSFDIPEYFFQPRPTITVEITKNGVHLVSGKVNGKHIEAPKSAGPSEIHLTPGNKDIAPPVVNVHAHQFTPHKDALVEENSRIEPDSLHH